MEATHYIEQWKDQFGVYHYTRPKEIREFNKALAKSRYGFKTIAVFKIALKPGVIIATRNEFLKTTIIEKA